MGTVARIWMAAWVVAVVLGTPLRAVAADRPAVARPSLDLGSRTETRGTVFFIETESRTGFAAIGSGHTFDLVELVNALRITFVLGNSGQPVAQSAGLLAPPGRPYNEPGATLLDDHMAYALDAPPARVDVLEVDAELPPLGALVRILGIPNDDDRDQAQIFGRVSEVRPTRIDVEREGTDSLRGWGGAPVVLEESGAVIGILQGSFPQDPTRLSISPIGGVLKVLREPLEEGAGRPFYRFASEEESVPETDGDEAAAVEEKPLPTLFPAYKDGKTAVQVEVQHPPRGGVVGDSACGVFVAGRALAHEGNLQRFDVALVIDTSRSTIDPAGADINGNGVVGRPRLGRVGSIFAAGSTDPGDTILAAEVAAARQLLRGLDPRSTRVSLVSFAGDPNGGGGMFSRGPGAPALTLEPLTNQYSRIERGLDSILEREPAGSTHMAAGVDQATVELLGLRGALSKPDAKAEKIVLFFTDGQPTLPYGPGFEADNVRAVLRAANRAHRASIRIHSFAIGPDALEGPVATVEMASRTNGYFTPVRHPGDLVDVVEQVSFADLSGVELRNLTTGEEAHPFRATADGSWGGFVKAQPGRNSLEVVARATDGTVARQTFDVELDPQADAGDVAPELVVARNRLLEDCLRLLKEMRLAAERQRAEQVRKDLMVEIERERAKARERADEQRKRLDLEAEEGE
jgi:hypothetical protein